MQHTPLVQTFSALSQHDRRELEKFVNSPAFNQRDDVKLLFRYLRENVQVTGNGGAAKSTLSKISAYEQVFPMPESRRATGYDDASMRHAMSFLYKLIKRYLAYTAWTENELAVGIHLCKALRSRGLDKIYLKEFTFHRCSFRGRYYFKN